jgi:[ribulose-bisphosphate carboxylase]/[fructose-bisphosphate aldolase]-lysine N-methyltransferase
VQDDATWLIENVFEKDRERFPETVVLSTNDKAPCFSVDGMKWALAIVQSRSFFVDGKLRLFPLLDFCNHSDQAQEIQAASVASGSGMFGGLLKPTTKTAQLVTTKKYAVGEQVFCSYGPKSAADYLLEHGFVPPNAWKSAVCELTFELDPEDRFYDDKLDILEFETYDQAPMDPTQSFDVVSAFGRDGEPDPAMIQFVRLMKLGSTDAFLLESIFRKDVFGFMELPVSETNELDVANTIISACEGVLADLNTAVVPETSGTNSNSALCTRLRESEKKALTRTIGESLVDAVICCFWGCLSRSYIFRISSTR